MYNIVLWTAKMPKNIRGDNHIDLKGYTLVTYVVVQRLEKAQTKIINTFGGVRFVNIFLSILILGASVLTVQVYK